MKTFNFDFETLKTVFNESYPNGGIFLDQNLNLNVHYTSAGCTSLRLTPIWLVA